MRLSGKVGKKGGDLPLDVTHWQFTLVLDKATHKLNLNRTRRNRTNSPNGRATLTRTLILTHRTLNAKGGDKPKPNNEVNVTLVPGNDRPQTLPSKPKTQQNPTHITPVVTTQAWAHTLTGKHPHGGRKRPNACLFEVG